MPNIVARNALVLVAAMMASVDAFWRMPCPGRLILERIDPLMAPFAVSGHVHTVSGGSGFGFNTTYDQQRESACSSCPIKADLSAYWTPKLYWRNKDNTQFRDVPQAGEYSGRTGGMTVYYQQRYSNATKKVIAFPKGFRMIAGNPFQRSFENKAAAPGQAVSFVCLDYAGGSKQYNRLPTKKCPDGVRAQLYFPSCWDGVNVDSPDHKSHVAYPIKGSYDNGQCPPSHPARLISIFYEVIYSTDQFSDKWWSTTEQPFVFAMGDPTGYGFHGDFVNGWDTSILQRAADQCTSLSGNIADCPVFNNDLYTDDQCQACRLPPQINEQITGTLSALPGCNPVTKGPARAKPVTACNKNPAIGAPQKYFTDVTTTDQWRYIGCATDNYYSRTLRGASTSGQTTTVESCIAFCRSKGFSLAGLEYAAECYCDDKFSSVDRRPSANILGGCDMPCTGNAEEICGGSSALSMYQSCGGGGGAGGAGGECKNVLFKVNGTVSG